MERKSIDPPLLNLSSTSLSNPLLICFWTQWMEHHEKSGFLRKALCLLFKRKALWTEHQWPVSEHPGGWWENLGNENQTPPGSPSGGHTQLFTWHPRLALLIYPDWQSLGVPLRTLTFWPKPVTVNKSYELNTVVLKHYMIQLLHIKDRACTSFYVLRM